VVGRWVWRGDGEPPAPFVTAIMGMLGVHGRLVARLLWNRDVRDPTAAADFLRPTLARGLGSPFLIRDMDRAARRLADAVAAGERIAVYGDYDVDGMTGAAQLVLFLRALGLEPLLHVSHRAREGYGLDVDALRALRRAGAAVVVTADCGTGDVRALEAAAAVGLDVIVCDHHHVPVTRPPAFALLNPHQPGCGFPFKGLSGAGVVFYLLMGLRAELRARGRTSLPDLRPYLDLVALGTVADVVPLRAENRVLVAHGLRRLAQTERAGLVALKETAMVEGASVHAIGFRLAPRLNAVGRLADARRGVELLTTASGEEARKLAAELEVHNAERRALEDAVVAEATAIAEMHVAAGASAALVVAAEGWHPGVVGIAAARLVERYRRPVVVLALDGPLARGSGRSLPGVDLREALATCGDLFETFGGHAQAVGLTLRREHVGVARARLCEVLARGAAASGPPALHLDAETSLREVTAELAATLAALEPHGPGNPEPVLLARDVEVQGVGLVGEPSRSHLKLRLRQDSRTVAAMGFGLGHLPVHAGQRVDVAFTPRLSRWRGVERLRFEILALRCTDVRAPPQPLEVAVESAIP
jgi:single-stranded-DNA-specific exonuclease